MPLAAFFPTINHYKTVFPMPMSEYYTRIALQKGIQVFLCYHISGIKWPYND